MNLRFFSATGFSALALAASLSFISGCDQAPGASRAEVVERPDQITDFKTLYTQNCAGCHGNDGRNGAALALSNPVYQAWVDDATLQRIISQGEPPTQMPAFAQSSGGMLTDAQVDALVKGMRTAWPANGAFNGLTPPASQPSGQSDAAQGQKTYQTACAQCHSKPNQQVTDPTYLALVNNRTLRTLIVTGRPDLGHPDWRGVVNGQVQPGYPLNDQQVGDIIAYLNSLRSDTPGQPYSPHSQQ
ncbi:cytochrome c oxidase cbb3-type subunit 3/ubiquinol-cytochrome c reductase cytochrome c subunit [Silvibacterium bohemicum]|uniref:Cytochrome c oxidase cbb3-type subunit 3/ubiquinol-cytochrome c reductase cytochrome c subunit n=1 Tax=Silvibacterium bohemicum TaxID=1577686 RepID=A0A841K6U6_9BACT|nr:c-type cytochrome [Silvibacterium bohemicum]MBB6146308.1 cytochrome c oxidase cbb3-type subunit 3/ubiquinol-cytochrome c reductase cytochrome c subunit [Silvibacterium bohemicum]